MYKLVRMIPFWNDRHLVNSACLNYERVSGKKKTIRKFLIFPIYISFKTTIYFILKSVHFRYRGNDLINKSRNVCICSLQ